MRRPPEDLSTLLGGVALTRRTVRFAWHTTSIAWIGVAALLLAPGCSSQETSMSRTSQHEQTALDFTNALASRDYEAAYALTSRGYQRRSDLAALRTAFEAIVPLDWGPVGPIEVGTTLDDWPGRQPADVGWVYVSIGGDVYSEGLTLIVTREDATLRIREVEFGRP